MVARLVGRADELSALLARCASEPPGAVLVTGEAYAEFGYRFAGDSLVPRLEAEILALDTGCCGGSRGP